MNAPKLMEYCICSMTLDTLAQIAFLRVKIILPVFSVMLVLGKVWKPLVLVMSMCVVVT